MTGPRLSIIPARAATDAKLKPRDLQVLCVLGRHTDELGWCRRSQVKMAREMDCARSTVHSAINRLLTCGYLERHEMETESGRDCAHLYRVVLDPAHDDLSAVQQEETDDDLDVGACETSVNLPCRYIGTPAGISAPPAGAESAPPAGPGPAPMLTTPINDPTLTEREGAGARACETGKGEKGKSRETSRTLKQAETLFWKLIKAWPQFDGMPKDRAKVAFLKLSPGDQDDALEKRDAWFALLKAQKKTLFPAPTKYCQQRLWLDLSTAGKAQGGVAQAQIAKPFGKMWGAKRFAALMAPPGYVDRKINSFQQLEIDSGRTTLDAVLLGRQALSGWPGVKTMHERAIDQHKGDTVSITLEPLAELFASVNVGSELWQAWADLHRDRGWPWIEGRRLPEWVYMPRPPDGGEGDAGAAVRQALADFERAHAALTLGDTQRKDAAE